MVEGSYHILSELLSCLKQELFEVNAEIQRNYLYIREEDACIKSIQESDSEEFKMFSPRSLNSLQKDEIIKANERKVDFQKQNEELVEKKKVIESRVNQLEKVLNQESHNLTALHVQEEDRKRIARDLHDTALQNLTHLIHKIELCGLYIDEDPIKAKLELSVIGMGLKETVNEIRNTIFDLRPMTFDDLGFKAGLERILDNANSSNKYSIVSDIDDVSCENNQILISIYRVIQESLTNIDKHAEADKIELKCKINGDFCVIDINDNGKGFNDQKDKIDEKHFGLSLMKERVTLLNGKIHINSVMGEGTKIHMEIPLAELD